MAEASQAIVLAEDRAHQRFIWRYLERLRYTRHQVRYEELPAGRGCGGQWVREHYLQAVRAYRWRSARAKTLLIVAIDADRNDVSRRVRQLESALAEAEQAARADAERIAHFIPKRSIETWIPCLCGLQVDEETDYSSESIDARIVAAAAAFYNWTRSNSRPANHCVPSLAVAVPEARRLE